MTSLWDKTSSASGFPRLNQDLKTDVLIIGGGMAGVLCAYMLHQANIPYVLVEARTIGGGITGNTTAKITSQHGLIYNRLIRRFGVEQAKKYLEANELALEKYRQLCNQIECDFESKDSYVYSVDGSRKIEKEL